MKIMYTTHRSSFERKWIGRVSIRNPTGFVHAIKSTRRHVKVSEWNSAFRQLEIRSHLTVLCVWEEGKQRWLLRSRIREGEEGRRTVRWTCYWWTDSSKTTTRSSRVTLGEGQRTWPLHHSILRIYARLHDDASRWDTMNGRARVNACLMFA